MSTLNCVTFDIRLARARHLLTRPGVSSEAFRHSFNELLRSALSDEQRCLAWIHKANWHLARDSATEALEYYMVARSYSAQATPAVKLELAILSARAGTSVTESLGLLTRAIEKVNAQDPDFDLSEAKSELAGVQERLRYEILSVKWR